MITEIQISSLTSLPIHNHLMNNLLRLKTAQNMGNTALAKASPPHPPDAIHKMNDTKPSTLSAFLFFLATFCSIVNAKGTIMQAKNIYTSIIVLYLAVVWVWVWAHHQIDSPPYCL